MDVSNGISFEVHSSPTSGILRTESYQKLQMEKTGAG